MFFFTTRHLKRKSSISEQDERWERFERKFFVNPDKTDLVRNLMTRICLPDAKYPQGKINSLYFDTPDLEHFQKSDDGDYKRHKIRIRWYDNPGTKGDVPIYLELKSKRGFASYKKRRQFLVPAEQIHKFKSGSSILNKNVILQTLAEFDYFPEDFLVPIIMITYKRYRFVEILSGTRMSLDWQIRYIPTNYALGHAFSNLMLQGAIIEIKGSLMSIPLSLKSLHNACIDWSRFSKYAACIESHMETNGSVGQIWPSGRIESQ